MGLGRKVRKLVSSNRRLRAELLGLLAGEGIEIGALHRALPARHLRVRYVDRLPAAELRKQYPELAEGEILEPDILDDGEVLASIPDASLDFVIASHVLEHLANPIGALLHWQRVLRPAGRVFLALPDKRFTFDRGRALTPIEHLVADFEHPSRERDYEAFRDFALEVGCRHFRHRPEAESEDLARELFERGYSIHYHVWTFEAFRALLDHLEERQRGWRMKRVAEKPTRGDEFFFVLERLPG